MAKTGEIDYLKNVSREYGEAAIKHAVGKPFSDPNCAKYLSEIAAILALLPPAPAKLLDLGCGTGWTSFFFAKAGYDVTGVDIAPDMILHAAERMTSEGQYQLRFLTADYEEFDGGGEFDAVVFYDALHHAVDEAAALRCAWRALKPQGVCIASEPGSGHGRSPDAVAAVRKYNVTEKAMSPAKVSRLGSRAGFRTCQVYPHAFRMQREIFPRRQHKPGPKLVRALLGAGRVAAWPCRMLYRTARLTAWNEVGCWVTGITVLVK
jgi:2-polyprenyl-3-methyl-5-hydroxy-6-metoxy-1,4-benzoquinol methylase